MNLRFEKKRQVLLGMVIVCVSSFIGIRTVHAAEKPEIANNEFVWFNGQQAGNPQNPYCESAKVLV